MLAQHLLSGLATGSIYALLALSVVMIYQTTRHINLAQGEIAMFTTFMAWQFMTWGAPYWLAFAATVIASFVLGVSLERVVIHPVRNAAPRLQIGAMIALFLIFNSLAGFLWGQSIRSVATPFGTTPLFGWSAISGHRAAMIVVAIAVFATLTIFLRKTDLGIRLSAAAENPTSARLVGIRVERMRMLGWGLAAAIGAIAGIMIAPIVFLEPQMMFVVFPYAVAAAVLGGLSSPLGAVVGGFALGVVETLATAYLPSVGRELKLGIALAVILAVLVVRPQGLVARRSVERV